MTTLQGPRGRKAIGRDLRARVNVYGPQTYRHADSKREAALEAARLTVHYEPEGLEFYAADRLELPGGNTNVWPVIVAGSPYAEDPIQDKDIPELERLLADRGEVLVRSHKKSTNVTSDAYRWNRELTLPPGRKFISRKMGLGTAAPHGVFYVLDDTEAPS